MLAKIVGRWSLEQPGTAVKTAPKTQQTRQLPLATKLAKKPYHNLIIIIERLPSPIQQIYL